jgi:hypothetical protein
MATNKLMEAAADILSGSKAKAPAMPPEKLDGEVVDIGGPTPENYKATDDSAKIHTTKAAKSATAPTTKPSAASSKVVDKLHKEAKEEDEDEDEDEDDEDEKEMKKTMKEDIDALFADDSTISEEFKSKVSTIFEA